MPKTLLILRHAKSSWDDESLADFDRPLSRRGHAAAHAIGSEMCRRGWVADLALVSPSRRTRETWDLVREDFADEIETRFDASIYEAAATTVLEAIRAMPARISTLLVIGHNPGLEDLSGMIAATESDPAALASLKAKFPTAALARFSTTGAWGALDVGVATLTDFLTPKSLPRAE